MLVGFYPAHDLFILDIPFVWYQKNRDIPFLINKWWDVGNEWCFEGFLVLGLICWFSLIPMFWTEKLIFALFPSFFSDRIFGGVFMELMGLEENPSVLFHLSWVLKIFRLCYAEMGLFSLSFSFMGTGFWKSADPVMLKWVLEWGFMFGGFSLLMSAWTVQRLIRNRLFYQHFTEILSTSILSTALFWMMIFLSPWW